jgi:hypothetical protein
LAARHTLGFNIIDGNIQVVRGGEQKTVSIFDLVVGDIVPLSIGGQVCPADFPRTFLMVCHLSGLMAAFEMNSIGSEKGMCTNRNGRNWISLAFLQKLHSCLCQ